MRDAGKDVPALDNRPSLVGYEWLWEAFWDLSTCRQIGMAAGPIPWTARQFYADTEKLGEHDAYLFHEVMKHMDSCWHEWHEANRTKAPKAKA